MGPEFCECQIIHKYLTLQDKLSSFGLILSYNHYDFSIRDKEDFIYYSFSSVDKVEGFLSGLECAERLGTDVKKEENTD